MTVHTNHMPPRTTDGDRDLAAARARRTPRISARRPGGYWLLLIAALGLGLMTEVHHASACGNAMVLSGDETAQTLSQAERQLAAGRADRAFVSALTVFWSLEEAVGLTEDGYDESGERPSERAEQRSERRKAALSARQAGDGGGHGPPERRDHLRTSTRTQSQPPARRASCPAELPDGRRAPGEPDLGVDRADVRARFSAGKLIIGLNYFIYL